MSRAFRGLTAVAACYILALAAVAAWSPGAVKRHQIESAAFLLAALWAAAVATRPPSSDGPSSDPDGERPFWIACAAAAAIGAASMWRAVFVGPLSDDYVLESWARAGRLLGDGGWAIRPIVVGLWRIVLQAGAGSHTLHAINLLLHASNSLLVVALARRLGVGLVGAAIAGAVFLVWPTQVEAVYWSSGMFDVFMTTCVLAALLLIDPDGRPREWAAGVLCAGAALMAKETAVVMPVLWVICYGGRVWGARPRARTVIAAGVLAGMWGLYFLWRLSLRLPVTSTTHVTRYVLKEQISRTFAGLGLPLTAETTASHPVLAVLLGVFVLALALAVIRQQPGGSAYTAARGLAWALVAAAPTIGILYVGPDLEGSRYLYLPCAGWGIFVGAGLSSVARAPGVVRAGVIALGVVAAATVAIERYRLEDQWVRAGRDRDAILAAAVDAAAAHDCGEAAFEDLPARSRGAQLFTNGFSEAFARVRGPGAGSHACRFAWTPRGFEVR